MLDLNNQFYEANLKSEYDKSFQTFSERAAAFDKFLSIFENTNKIMEDLFTDINFGLRLNPTYKSSEEIKKDALKNIRKIREYSQNRCLIAKSLEWLEDLRKKVLELIKQNKESFKNKDNALDLEKISMSIDERLNNEILSSFDKSTNEEKISKCLQYLKKFDLFDTCIGSNNINDVFYVDLSMMDAYLSVCIKEFKDYSSNTLQLVDNDDYNLFNVS